MSDHTWRTANNGCVSCPRCGLVASPGEVAGHFEPPDCLPGKVVADRLWQIEIVSRADYTSDAEAFQAVKQMIFTLRRDVEAT